MTGMLRALGGVGVAMRALFVVTYRTLAALEFARRDSIATGV